MSFFSTDPFTLLARVIVLLTAIPVHEAAHAYVADRLGDPTARYAGRLTLNPFAHYNLWGTLSLLAFGIGWAEPVPINPMNFDDRKKGMAISAAAGPTSNLIMTWNTKHHTSENCDDRAYGYPQCSVRYVPTKAEKCVRAG